MISIRPRTEGWQKISLKLKVAGKTLASMHQSQVESLVEKCLAAGILTEPQEEGVCPNCGREMSGTFCRKCNQPAEKGELLDQDEDGDDRAVDDHSDSEDADDYDSFDVNDEGDLLSEVSVPSFAEIFSQFLASLGITDADIRMYLYLLRGMTEKESGIDDFLRQDLVMAAAEWSGKTEEYVQTLWKGKPFSQDNLDEIFEEWLIETGRAVPAAPADFEEPLLEIRKVEGEYISIVHDRFEDVRTAPGKGRVPIPLKKIQIPAGLFLLTLRKRNRNLQRILETIVERRRDFLDAPTRDDALRVLRERPLELVDIASETGIDRGIISRHFSTKAVFTPHEIFMLGDLVSPKSRTGKEITVSALHDKILKIIEQGDSEGRFFSDRKVVEVLKEEYEIKASREHIQKIREKFGIPNSRKRRGKAMDKASLAA